ncbi:hypothetical protein VKT23_000298 [Stygiomarasmius scandens]|uniref:Uncharacterized protein n=1 Tax=Marasmiellus scandens TaxID=2682957 RepID=A0ABR1K5J6_9AGAR
MTTFSTILYLYSGGSNNTRDTDVGDETSFSFDIPEDTDSFFYSVTSSDEHLRVSDVIPAESCVANGPQALPTSSASTSQVSSQTRSVQEIRIQSTISPTQTINPDNHDDSESTNSDKPPALPTSTSAAPEEVSATGTSEQQEQGGNALSGTTLAEIETSTSEESQLPTTDLSSGNGSGETPSNSVGPITASGTSGGPKQTNDPAGNIGTANSGLTSGSQSTPVINPNGTSTGTESGTITSPTGKSAWSHSSKSRAGAIIGGAIGGAAFALLLISLGVCLLRRRKAPWERLDPFPRHGNSKADDYSTSLLKVLMSTLTYAAKADVIEPEARFLDAGVRVQSPTRESLIHATTHDDSNDEPGSSNYDNTSVRAVLPSRTSGDTDDGEEKYIQVVKRIPRGRTRPTPPVVHTEYTLDQDPFSDGSPVHFLQSSSPSFAFPAIDSGLSSMLVDGTYQASCGRNDTSGTEWEAERTGLHAEIEQLRSQCARLESIAGLPPPTYERSVR